MSDNELVGSAYAQSARVGLTNGSMGGIEGGSLTAQRKIPGTPGSPISSEHPRDVASQTATINVLHIDDDPAFATMTAKFIEREDCLTVESETNPMRVIERFDSMRQHIDCIVSDYQMPGMNGVELCESVRMIDESIPFILFSATWEHRPEEIADWEVTDAIPKGGVGNHHALIARIIECVSEVRHAEHT